MKHQEKTCDGKKLTFQPRHCTEKCHQLKNTSLNSKFKWQWMQTLSIGGWCLIIILNTLIILQSRKGHRGDQVLIVHWISWSLFCKCTVTVFPHLQSLTSIMPTIVGEEFSANMISNLTKKYQNAMDLANGISPDPSTMQKPLEHLKAWVMFGKLSSLYLCYCTMINNYQWYKITFFSLVSHFSVEYIIYLDHAYWG